jgi:hypothetical protein
VGGQRPTRVKTFTTCSFSSNNNFFQRLERYSSPRLFLLQTADSLEMSNCRPFIHFFPPLWWREADSFPSRRRHLFPLVRFYLSVGGAQRSAINLPLFLILRSLEERNGNFSSNDFPFFWGPFYFTVSSPYLIRMPMIRPRNVITDQRTKITDQMKEENRHKRMLLSSGDQIVRFEQRTDRHCADGSVSLKGQPKMRPTLNTICRPNCCIAAHSNSRAPGLLQAASIVIIFG